MRYSIRILPLFAALIIVSSGTAHAGLSGSVSYDLLPYQEIDEPIATEGGATIDNAEVKLSKLNLSLEYPLIFSQGRTILINGLSYQQIDFSYHNTESILNRLHRVSYSATLMRQMSEKWSLLFMVNPSLASDFESGLNSEDLSFQTAVIANRRYSEKLSIGYGAAYSTQFGTPVPLPIIMLEWNNGGNWSISSILPANIKVWYKAGEKVDLGFLISTDGDNYHFDPQGYLVDRPELRYTMMTLGPAARIALSDKITLNIEGGIIGLHQFEFYSDDEKILSNDLKPSQYLRAGLKVDF